MGLLKPVGQVGFLKGGFLGFNKSGKSFTMALLAVGVKRFFKLPGPIAMYDTEGGSEYIGPMVKALTGSDLLVVKSRSLDDLASTVRECVDEKVAVLIAESMTHVWRNLCDSYMEQVNAKRAENRQSPRRNLEFQDWGPLKGIWNGRWSDVYLNAPLHILIAGRAGYEYDMQENEETHKKELIKTGVKMKTEGEFGFEPSLLVEMERESIPDGHGGFVSKRRATIIGDRFGVIDARTTLFGDDDPEAPMSGEEMLAKTFAFFEPHIALLRPGAHTPIDTTSRTETGADADGNTDWARERKTREILCEEIAGELVAHGLSGQATADKEKRLALLFTIFQTRSWTAIENMHSERLRDGLAAIRRHFAPPDTATTEINPEEAERQAAAAACEGHEARLRLDLVGATDLRSKHGCADLATASLDALVTYREALAAMAPASEVENGHSGARKPRQKKTETPAPAGA